MKRETIRDFARIALIVFLYTWLVIRAPLNIYNFYVWVDVGVMLSGAILGVLWLIEKSEKDEKKDGQG